VSWRQLRAAGWTQSEIRRVTSPARTLIDFAATAAQTELMQALGEAVARNLTDERELGHALERVPANHPGAAVVRAILRDQPQLIHTRSVAERSLLPAIRRAGLPAPLVNHRVCGELVDLYWPEHKLVVECDGFQFHRSRTAFESDRRRDAKLIAAGLRVIRVTWRQLQHEP
jgi:very-short-patch-repair endonuclease